MRTTAGIISDLHAPERHDPDRVDAGTRLLLIEAATELEGALNALGVTYEEAEDCDDPDVATLAQSITVTLEYEEQKREMAVEHVVLDIVGWMRLNQLTLLGAATVADAILRGDWKKTPVVVTRKGGDG